jgi:histidinol-phosphate/aromatic aminotransferase/cobyric acid decarboxylase-like protein
VRITLGTTEHTDRLLKVLRETLEEIGMTEAISR